MEKEIKIGDLVKWKCRPYQAKPFISEGIVREISESTFGGMVKKPSVKVETIGAYKRFFPYRKTTVIGLDKIIKE